jgi:L-2-hydroxyglutarate oxidase
VVNAAGLYADRVARAFGFSERYRILPFKGLYLFSRRESGDFRTNIYPVPNLRNPFLGVHLSITLDGRARIGPTAIPALWREHYSGLSRFRAGEFAQIAAMEISLLLRAGFDFRGLAMQEARKISRRVLVQHAASMVEGIRAEDYTEWGRPGIRAQLVDVKARKLVMDFLLEGDERSLHVLNAVSPAFTCSIPFARYVCDEIARLHG